MGSLNDPVSGSLTLHTLNHIPLIAIMEHAAIPWGIKNKESKFVYLNKASIEFLNIPTGFDFEGRRDDEFPCAWSELAPDFQKQDRAAEESSLGADVITTSYYGRQAVIEPYYCPKFAINDNQGEILGTAYYIQKFKLLSVSEFFDSLKPSVITLTPPDATFTESELDIIFYARQGLSEKEIAERLFLSTKALEARLAGIYSKISVQSLSQLNEYCRATALKNYMPKKIFKEGVEFFW